MTPDFEDLDLPSAPDTPAAGPRQASSADDLGVTLPSRRRRRGPGPRTILFAGVAGACVLGVGMGLWARPQMNERRVAVAAPEPEGPAADPATRQLKIVIGDGPAAPVGAPIETLHPVSDHGSRPMFATLRPRQDGQGVMGAVPELTRLEPRPLPKLEAPKFEMPRIEASHLQAPKLPDLAPVMIAALAAPGHWLEKLKPAERPPMEVARLDAPAKPSETHRAQRAQAERAAKAAQAEAARDAAHQAQAEAAEKAEVHRAELAEAAQLRQAKLQQARLEQAREAKAEQARLQQAKLVQAQKVQAQQVRLDKAKTDKADKLRLAKAEKTETQKLALAEAKGRAEARAEAHAEAKALVLAEARDDARKRQRLEALVHAVQKVLPHAQARQVETARQDRKDAARGHRQDPVVERASLKTHKAQRLPEPPARARPAPPPMPTVPSGLVKVSTARCASRDPGAALVCADPNLSAADRQLSRAYQGARAAGVPEIQLQAQQQRWLAARATAAREAPWAVRDVYLARIAELNGQAREAHSDGY